MQLERYQIFRLDEFPFQFFSEGKNGRFELRILFESISENLYNLAFGVWNAKSKTLDDSIELRNGDSDKILATVAATAMNFLHTFPFANIFATGFVQPGRLAVRNRKYQMAINKYYSLLDYKYNLFGFVAERISDSHGLLIVPGSRGKWEVFTHNRQYNAFLLSRKF